jgi:hypothetical protein
MDAWELLSWNRCAGTRRKCSKEQLIAALLAA